LEKEIKRARENGGKWERNKVRKGEKEKGTT